MSLPNAVRVQVERANEIADKMFVVHGDGEPTPTPEGNTPPEGTPPVQEPTPPKAGNELEVQPTPVDNGEEATFKHKYQVLQGKYNEEGRRMNERIQSLETLLAKLADNQATPSVTPVATEEKPSLDVIPEFEELQVEFNDVYKGVGQALTVRDKATQEVKKQVDKVEAMLQANALNTFMTHLNTAVPDADTINSDPLFVEWLHETIPYTNVTKFEAINKAFQFRDAGTVIQIFRDFKEHEKTLGQVTTPTQAIPTPPNPNEKYVVPPRASRGVQSGNTQEKKTYRKEDVNQFYRDLAQRKLPWTKEQIAAREVEYFTAAKEGRIV